MIKPWDILKNSDLEIKLLLDQEFIRQQDSLNLIASENYTSLDVMFSSSNTLTNKYAEGLPNKRYYGGCEIVDKIENIAIERAKKLFKANFANVQPHSGAQANEASYQALANPGDVILGLDLSHGGHLTHGSKVNFSGKIYKSYTYDIQKDTGIINYQKIYDLANKIKPKIIVSGASSYPLKIDFSKFKEISLDTGAYLIADMSHISGLVACGLHQNPLKYADIITSTTHKTLRGPRGGIILWNDDKFTKSVNSAVFPGTQGGPLQHVIAAKAVCFKEALSKDFTIYQKQVLLNTSTLAKNLIQKGFKLIGNGSDNHLLLIDLSSSNISGKDMEESLSKANIIVNKNTIPGEKRSPFVTSGIRIGSPSVTSRGLKEADMIKISNWIYSIFLNIKDDKIIFDIKEEVKDLLKKYPLYPEISV